MDLEFENLNYLQTDKMMIGMIRQQYAELVQILIGLVGLSIYMYTDIKMFPLLQYCNAY